MSFKDICPRCVLIDQQNLAFSLEFVKRKYLGRGKILCYKWASIQLKFWDSLTVLTWIDDKIFAVILMACSYFGTLDIPNDPNWNVEQGWVETENPFIGRSLTMQASSTAIVEECKKNPNTVISFPHPFAAAHEIFLDGKLTAAFRDPTFASVTNCYAKPTLPCNQVLNSKVVSWRIYSPNYSEGIRAFPTTSSKSLLFFFFNSKLKIFAGGALIFLAFLLLLLFYGKSNSYILYGVAASNAFFGLDILLRSPLLEFVDLSIYAWKFASFSLAYLAEILLFQTLHQQKFISSLGARFYIAVLCLFILLSLALSEISSLIFLKKINVGLFGIAMAEATIFLALKKKRQTVVSALTLLAFFALVLLSFLSLLVPNLAPICATFFPFCILALLICQALEINNDVTATIYQNCSLSDDIRHKDQRMQTIDLTTKMLAHDIRRPFSMTKALIQILARAKSSEDFMRLKNQFSRDIESAMRRVSAMLEDISQLNQASHGSTVPVSPRKSVQNALAEIFASQESATTSETIFLHVSKVMANESKLERVIANILSNAVKAMKGHGEIVVKTQEKDAGVEIAIRNSNSYIRKEDIPKLFEPFYTTDSRVNFGLGLAICRTLVKSFGGEIHCYSQNEPKFTEFSIWIPAAKDLDELS